MSPPAPRLKKATTETGTERWLQGWGQEGGGAGGARGSQGKTVVCETPMARDVITFLKTHRAYNTKSEL